MHRKLVTTEKKKSHSIRYAYDIIVLYVYNNLICAQINPTQQEYYQAFLKKSLEIKNTFKSLLTSW